jgi:hypothetical protein
MKRVLLSILVAILTVIVAIILADALRATQTPGLVKTGDFLGGVSGLLGAAAGIWFYLAGERFWRV